MIGLGDTVKVVLDYEHGVAAALEAAVGGTSSATCKSWAATATAMISGRLSLTPGTPMGQVMCASSASV
mgnify:CR=1 FL=1